MKPGEEDHIVHPENLPIQYKYFDSKIIICKKKNIRKI
jgi:hypothetical protein